MTAENMTNKSIYQAFLEAQKKIKPVKKDAKNPFYNSRYATLEAVINNVKEPLNEVGICILQPIMGDRVVTRLLFTDGTTIEDGGTPIVCKADNDPQAQGSAITYARRYGLMSLLGLPADDDDGEAATSRKPAPVPDKIVETDDEKLCDVCGSRMNFKSGSKDGKSWAGYFCPNSTKENKHPPVWTKA